MSQTGKQTKQDPQNLYIFPETPDKLLKSKPLKQDP